MLDYTKAAFKKTVDDFKRIDYIRNVLTQLVYIAYLVYALVVAKDYLWANILLLTLSVAYFVFFLFATTGKRKADKRTKSLVKSIYKRCKQLIKLFTLGLTVYGFCLTANHFTPISLFFVALMIVGWILQIVFEIILRIFVNRVNLFMEGLEADYQNLIKPAKTVGNFFKKLTGKEIEPEKEPTKNRLLLDKKVAQAKQEALQKKQEKKLEKQRLQEQRQAQRLQKEQEKKRLKEERKTQIRTEK